MTSIVINNLMYEQKIKFIFIIYKKLYREDWNGHCNGGLKSIRHKSFLCFDENVTV